MTSSADALGLQPRDVNLFAAQPQGLSNQRASLTPRNRAVLFKTEVVRALIRSSTVFVFPCKCARPLPLGCPLYLCTAHASHFHVLIRRDRV